ncbi:S-adenosyl-L-methionine-dependent methyltransferase [Xylariaceae sp. FL1019]|nr:S-adenosyl-L-methionine-dependent methyltransferase [Xylariaceae sp. FL1019]
MPGATGDPYMLNNEGEWERRRLNEQFYFIHDVMNQDLLPPHIAEEVAANPNVKIVELATGSGVWVEDMAKTLPETAELVGLDYNADNFPKNHAKNVSFDVANFLEPFPEKYWGKFDVVHFRICVMGMKVGYGPTMIKHAQKLLKPGGWFTWTDLQPMNAYAEPPSEAVHRFNKLFYAMCDRVGLDRGIPLAIPKWTREGGLVDVGSTSYHINGDSDKPFKQGDWIERQQTWALGALTAISKSILALGGGEGLKTQEDLDELLPHSKKDLSGDAKFNLLVLRVWGRLPA